MFFRCSMAIEGHEEGHEGDGHEGGHEAEGHEEGHEGGGRVSSWSAAATANGLRSRGQVSGAVLRARPQLLCAGAALFAPSLLVVYIRGRCAIVEPI